MSQHRYLTMIAKDFTFFRQSCRLSIALFSAIFFSCVSAAAQDSGARQISRFASPATITCDRNRLTSWTGVITRYRRESAGTWLVISTDENTVEHTKLDHEGQADASAHYLLWGKPFMAQDWTVIEQSPGVLNKGMRATVWICKNGVTPPVVDWQPPRD